MLLSLPATLTTVEKKLEFGHPRYTTADRWLQPVHWLVDANVRMFESWPVKVLIAFFVMHIIVRSLLPMPLGFDEGEQFIVTQEFALGYGAQPPLYNWLQHVFFNVFGVNEFAMILLKQSILLATFLTTYGLWRKTGLTVALASACTFSLFLLNEVGWELQRTRTHLALAVLMAAAFAFITILIYRQSESRATARRGLLYTSLGAVVGLGLLSKYNFAVFPCGLIIATLLSKDLRKTVLTPWSLLSLLVAVAVVLPHGIWVVENLDWIASQSRDKFGLVDEYGVLQSRREGANAFGGAVFMFFLLPMFAGTIFYLDWRDWNVPSLAVFALLDKDTRRLVNVIGVACAVSIVLVFLIVVCSGMTVVRSRWFVPVAFLSLPPLMLRTRVLRGPNTHRIYWLGVLTIMLASSIAITTVAVDGLNPAADSRHLPVLAGPLWDAAAADSQKSAVVIEDQRLAGLIRMKHPNMKILVPDYGVPDLNDTDVVVVIAEVTDAGRFSNAIVDFVSELFPQRLLGESNRLDETGTAPEDGTCWTIARLRAPVRF